jgi:chorismate-pyruvate lyase
MQSSWGGAVANRLVERHFTLQHEETTGLSRVEIVALDPALRTLLFTDGTVTRALEAQTLRRVTVEVVDQSRASAVGQTARLLDIESGSECVRRRIAMSTIGPAPSVWAESYILPDRLPSEFVKGLDSASHGIGGSIEQTKLESRRELLWFGLGGSPIWADAPASTTALIRLYRIITNDRPALLICESFAVEQQLDLYGPYGWSELAGCAGGESALSMSE